MTDIASRTKIPPIIIRTNSCFVITAIEAKIAPNEREPVSPIKIIAGGALNHRKPRQLPNSAQHKILNSPENGMKFMPKYSEKTKLPAR